MPPLQLCRVTFSLYITILWYHDNVVEVTMLVMYFTDSMLVSLLDNTLSII